MTDVANLALYLAEKYGIAAIESVKKYERALKELRPRKIGGTMLEYENHLSEASVEDFIKAAKIIVNESGGSIRITDRDENMMRSYLTSQRIDGKGILVCVCPRHAGIKSSRFEASWSRR